MHFVPFALLGSAALLGFGYVWMRRMGGQADFGGSFSRRCITRIGRTEWERKLKKKNMIVSKLPSTKYPKFSIEDRNSPARHFLCMPASAPAASISCSMLPQCPSSETPPYSAVRAYVKSSIHCSCAPRAMLLVGGSL